MIQSEKLNQLTRMKHNLMIKESNGQISDIDYETQLKYIEDNMRSIMNEIVSKQIRIEQPIPKPIVEKKKRGRKKNTKVIIPKEKKPRKKYEYKLRTFNAGNIQKRIEKKTNISLEREKRKSKTIFDF